jgi:hypothetical protein
MGMNRLKAKGRRNAPRFFQLLFALLDHPAYIALPHPAKSLLNDIGRQYNGRNNGDLCVTLSIETAWLELKQHTKASTQIAY